MIVEKRIPVGEIKRGMYISRLDRPWTEVPLLFQGFYISSDREIRILHENCKEVYIDTERTNAPKTGMDADSDPDLIAPLPPPERVYENVCTAAEEMPKAEKSIEQLQTALIGTLKNLKDGKTLDINHAGEAVQALVSSMIRNPDAMMLLKQLRDIDDYAYDHSLSVSVLGVAFARHLGFNQQDIKHFALGSLLLDIGKIKISEDILKRPGKLSAEEFEEVKTHVKHGVKLVRSDESINDITLTVIQCHHERFDGSGYPGNLKGKNIPIYGRMAGIIDTYSAMTANRPHSPAIPPHEAIRTLYELRGSHFQKELVEQFIQCIGAYPTGSLVELSNGEVGIVVEQNKVRRLRPTLMVVLDAEKIALKKPKMINLMDFSVDSRQEQVDILKPLSTGAFGIRPEEYYL